MQLWYVIQAQDQYKINDAMYIQGYSYFMSFVSMETFM